MDAITLRDLRRDMEALQEDFDEIVYGPWIAPVSDFWFSPVECDCYPAVDVIRGKDYYRMLIELPGLTEKDFNLEVTRGNLEISGKRPDWDGKDGAIIHRESMTGEFCRTFELPEDVDSERIEANFKNGLLEVKLPRRERGGSEKHIKVEVH